MKLRACDRWAYRAPCTRHPHRFYRSAGSYKPQQERLVTRRRLQHGWVLWLSEDSRVSGGYCEGSNLTPRSGGWQSAGSGCVDLHLSKLGARRQEGQLGATRVWAAGRKGIRGSNSLCRTRGLEVGRSWRTRTGVRACAWESGGERASRPRWPRKPCGAAGCHATPDFQGFSFPPPSLPGSPVSQQKRDQTGQAGQVGRPPKTVAVVD